MTWRLIEILEAALGVMIIHVIGLIIPGHWGLLQLQPHPLWIVVLAIAVRYGAPSGYVAGFFAAVSYTVSLWIHPDALMRPLAAHDVIQPFLFFVGGALVSEVVRGHRLRLLKADLDCRRASDELHGITQQYEAALEVKAELEKRIVGQPTSLAQLYEAAMRLETLHVAELHPAILDLVVDFLDAQACALYLQKDGQFHVQVGRPEVWPGRAQAFSLETELIARVVSEREVVTVRDRLLAVGPTALAREPVLMAGPLLGREGQVYGVVVVEHLPFLKFTPTSIRMFDLILDWASAALQNALLHEEMRDRTVEHEQTAIFKATHTTQLLQNEFLRAQRYQVPLSVILVQVDDFPAVRQAVQLKLLQALGLIFRHHLRTVGILGHHIELDKFVLILPLTPVQGSRDVARRMNDALQSLNLQPYNDDRPLAVRFGIASFSPDLASPDELLTLALADLRNYSTATIATRNLVQDLNWHWLSTPALSVLLADLNPELSLRVSANSRN